MSKKNKTYTKIGTVLEGQYGPYIILGSSKNKDPKYDFEVQVLVKNAKGEKVKLVKNPLLSLYDPRNRTDKDGNPRKVPDSVKFEVSIVTEDGPSNE